MCRAVGELVYTLTLITTLNALAISSYSDKQDNGRPYTDDDILRFIDDIYRTEPRQYRRNLADSGHESGRDPYPRREAFSRSYFANSNSAQDSDIDYSDALAALRSLLDDDDDNGYVQGFTSNKPKTDEYEQWDKEPLQSQFAEDEGVRQSLLMNAYLEDMMDNADTRDWPAASFSEETDQKTEKKQDETKELIEYSDKNDGRESDDDVTSDGKKLRDNWEDKKSDAEAKVVQDVSEDKKESEDIHVDEEDAGIESAELKNDVDELRSLLTEMMDSSRKDGNEEQTEADAADAAAAAEGNPDISIEVKIPGVSVSQDDTYLCTSVKIQPKENSTEPIYVVEYVPHAKEAVAHHMLMYGCSSPGLMDEQVWDCGGEMAGNGRSQQFKKGSLCGGDGQQTILWAWAKDAPLFKLPKDVGFKVGPQTNIHYLVLQVHYKSASVFKDGRRDHSGVTVVATESKKPRLAGVYVMASSIGTVAPYRDENFDIACPYRQVFTMHPFAFRTHTHALGVEVLGFRIRDGDWSLIGAKNPQLPEAFYPTATKNMTIRYNDILAARCRMSNFRSIPTSIGYRHTDEMCNFYVMFWVESKYEKELESWSKGCSNGFPWIHWRDLPGFYE